MRRPSICAGCATRDCLRGNERARGCELDLLAPRKNGSLDCTFCLDCVRACPHDNIGLVAGAPGRALLRDPDRSSLGRLSRRPDVAALALVVVFGAFASGVAMVAPVAPPAFAAALVVTPGLLAVGAAAIGRWLANVDLPLRAIVCRFALALVPLGLSMWTAHFLLHLVAGWRSIVPVLQGFAPALLGRPNWELCLPGIASNALLAPELLLLDAGLLVTLWVGWRIASDTERKPIRALGLLGPWALLATALWLGGAWTFVQPMAMRGLASPG